VKAPAPLVLSRVQSRIAVRIMWFRACELTLKVLVEGAGADGGVAGGVSVVGGGL